MCTALVLVSLLEVQMAGSASHDHVPYYFPLRLGVPLALERVPRPRDQQAFKSRGLVENFTGFGTTRDKSQQFAFPSVFSVLSLSFFLSVHDPTENARIANGRPGNESSHSWITNLGKRSPNLLYPRIYVTFITPMLNYTTICPILRGH